MPNYCNTTSDLTDIFPGIENYQTKEILKNWTAVSGSTGLYYKGGTGQVNMVFDDNVQLTSRTTSALVYATAGSFCYLSDSDLLYVHVSGSADPADSTMEAGEDWDAFKDRCLGKAMQFMDSVLGTRYPVPLSPRDIQTHDTASYEYPIVECAAYLTSHYIARRRSPQDENAIDFWKKVWNQNPDIGESKGLLNMLADGDIVLQNQIAPREVGSWNIYPASGNTVTEDPILIAPEGYLGNAFRIWRIQIDGTGTRGAATWKVSYDGGTTWDKTEEEMEDADKDQYRMYVGDGVYVYWPEVSTYSTTDDYWDVHLFPYTDKPDFQKFATVDLRR